MNHTPPTDLDLDEIAARAAALYEYADPTDAAWEILAGDDVPLLLAEIRRQRDELATSKRIRENADFHLGQEMARRQLAEKEAARLQAVLTEIRHLHKDSPMGPCPVCIDADAAAAGGDGLVPYPCPTARLAGAQGCDPPHVRAVIETGTRPCGHDDYHDPHEWADRPSVWCPGLSHDDTESAAAAVSGGEQ